MHVAGIDVSTKAIDVVALNLDDDHATWHRYELRGGDLIDRVRAAQGFRHWRPWQWEDCLAVGVERPAGRHGVAQVSMVFGAVLASLPHRLLVQPWMPAEWKKAIGLRGNAGKDDVINWARGAWSGGLYGFAYSWDSHACDACAIAYATRRVIEIGEAAA